MNNDSAQQVETTVREAFKNYISHNKPSHWVQTEFSHFKAGFQAAQAATIAELETLVSSQAREIERYRDGLAGIGEYWNGASESAVDAAEECRDRALSLLNPAPGGEGSL